MRDQRVAIIGAGPSGLVAARYLARHGFEPVVFEQSDGIGGQWNASAPHSGVWPRMRTNTSRVTTCFSDLAYDADVPVYPSGQQVGAYLGRYAEQCGLMPHIRLRTPIRQIRRDSHGSWAVDFTDPDGTSGTEVLPRVVVATGRYNKPKFPVIPGIDSFSGVGGRRHTFEYAGPDAYHDLRVLVAGCSISALEIASEIAAHGASRVVATYRRQRYIVHKLTAGVPADHVAFTRFAALAEESLPPELNDSALRDFVVRTSGSPEQFGAWRPAGTIREAGVTLSQNFLPLVAEGRITPKPWITAVDGRTVRFGDDSTEQFDAIILGTGYDLHLPFFGDEVRRLLAIDAEHVDLHGFTVHPELPGLAFIGMYELIGPYFPAVELQARWLAYAWSRVRPFPSRAEMDQGVAAYRARRGGPQQWPMHSVAIPFARAAGAEPKLDEWPQLAAALLFGPLSALSFRLSGPDSRPDAAARVEEQALAFGALSSARMLTPEQRDQVQVLAHARKDEQFTAYVARLMAGGAA